MSKKILILGAGQDVRKLSARDLLFRAEKAAQERLNKGEALRLSPRAEDGQEANIFLQDVIGSWFGIAAADFIGELESLTANIINLHVNSPGGDVFEARDIQAAIGRRKAAGTTFITHINGIAASAATYISFSANEVRIADGGMLMVHNAWSWMAGNAKELRQEADVLEKIDAGIARDYERKTGASAKQIKEWMDNETWFDAAEALKNGFVDSVFIPGEEEKEPEAKANKLHGVCHDSATMARRLQFLDDFGN